MFNLPSVNHEDDWREQAECYKRRDEVQALNKDLGYDIFYPEKGKTVEAFKYAERLFCRRCPVSVACYSEGKDEQGTWGGATEKTRRRQALSQNTVLSILLARQKELWPDENKSPNEELNRDPESA